MAEGNLVSTWPIRMRPHKDRDLLSLLTDRRKEPVDVSLHAILDERWLNRGGIQLYNRLTFSETPLDLLGTAETIILLAQGVTNVRSKFRRWVAILPCYAEKRHCAVLCRSVVGC
jgi:hypothetical protein